MLLFLFCIFCLLLLYTPFVSGEGLANGLVMGKVFWIHLVMGIGYLALFVSLFQKKMLKLNAADGLLIAYYLSILLTYSWKLNPEPEKLALATQLVGLWFILRQALTLYRPLAGFILLLLTLGGLSEALLGMAQLHGWALSNHSLFNITGTFYNPGPYSGYLALLLPICLSFTRHHKPFPKYYGWLCVMAILLVLPAGMSRTAWLAALIGCGYLVYQWNRTKVQLFAQKHPKYLRVLLVAGCLFGMGCLYMGYHLKKDSADGRFLLWKVTTEVITRHPLSGTGLGGFPAAYAQAQADYLQQATPREALVAGCPEYAFNEFLQIGAEQGVLSLSLFLLWLGSIGYYAQKQKRTGIIACLIAFMLFACASYPLQLPEFWLLFISLGAISATPEIQISPAPRLKTITIGLLVTSMLIGGYALFCQKDYYPAYRGWSRLQTLYQSQAYSSIADDYLRLASRLSHKPEVLFEAAQCQSKTGNPQEAVRLLKRATRLSADPMIHYMLAKNEQALCRYQEAEKTLLYALRILPERIYPYYLLVRLYAEPDYQYPEKLKAAADSVLTKEPKVNSSAIREMRENVRKLLLK